MKGVLEELVTPWRDRQGQQHGGPLIRTSPHDGEGTLCMEKLHSRSLQQQLDPNIRSYGSPHSHLEGTYCGCGGVLASVYPRQAHSDSTKSAGTGLGLHTVLHVLTAAGQQSSRNAEYKVTSEKEPLATYIERRRENKCRWLFKQQRAVPATGFSAHASLNSA